MKYKLFKTYNQKQQDLNAKWYLIDANGLPLGRLATATARLLVGKHKPTYTPHLNDGDCVVVINSDKVTLSGRKETDKIYYRHSGYIGNLRSLSAEQLRAKDSTKMIYLAVRGMLPKNKLRAPRLNRLKIYSATDHPHQPQQPTVYQIPKPKRVKQ